MQKYFFLPFPVLITNSLILRRVTKDDAREIFFLRSDEKVLQFLLMEPAATLCEAEAFIEKIDKMLETKEAILWGICIKENPGKLIGTIGFWKIQSVNFRAEIGYVLHPEYWQQGFMKEALAKVMEYGASVMQLHSVEARINSTNSPSAATLQAIGFQQEGYLKEDIYFRGKFYDSIIFSLLLPSKYK